MGAKYPATKKTRQHTAYREESGRIGFVPLDEIVVRADDVDLSRGTQRMGVDSQVPLLPQTQCGGQGQVSQTQSESGL